MENLTALIIEDNSHLADFYKMALELSDYTTVTVLSGKLALQKLETLIPDLIILDLNLPDMPGRDILHTIRSRENLADTQVVVITGEVKGLDRNVEAIADFYLVKPVDFDQVNRVASRVRESLSNR